MPNRKLGQPLQRHGRSLHPTSVQLLDYLRAHPGRSTHELQVAFPDIPMRSRLDGLRVCGHVVNDSPEHRALWWASDTPAELRTAARPVLYAKVLVAAPAGPVVKPREVRIDEPWPEPYLPETGMRSSGLQYRDCPSRRGDQFVYCYRRQA